jgi:hypothetical protein
MKRLALPMVCVVCVIWKWKLLGPNRDLHSGIYGGGVDNPLNVLCKLIGGLKDDNGHITVEDFYGDVIELQTKKKNKSMPFRLQKRF